MGKAGKSLGTWEITLHEPHPSDPSHQDVWVGIVARIRDNHTGEVRSHVCDELWPVTNYMWTDGNYGCDCNRGIFFRRAGQEDDDPPDKDEEEETSRCGTGRYSVRLINPVDGKVIHSEFDEDTLPLNPPAVLVDRCPAPTTEPTSPTPWASTD